MTCRILIVEDDYWAALHLATAVRDRGATVLGPTGSIPLAVALMSARRRPHAAILDVQLRTQLAFPLADALAEQGVPFIFVTGFEREDMPERFDAVPHFVKPIIGDACIDAVMALADAARRTRVFGPQCRIRSARRGVIGG